MRIVPRLTAILSRASRSGPSRPRISRAAIDQTITATARAPAGFLRKPDARRMMIQADRRLIAPSIMRRGHPEPRARTAANQMMASQITYLLSGFSAPAIGLQYLRYQLPSGSLASRRSSGRARNRAATNAARIARACSKLSTDRTFVSIQARLLSSQPANSSEVTRFPNSMNCRPLPVLLPPYLTTSTDLLVCDTT